MDSAKDASNRVSDDNNIFMGTSSDTGGANTYTYLTPITFASDDVYDNVSTSFVSQSEQECISSPRPGVDERGS